MTTTTTAKKLTAAKAELTVDEARKVTDNIKRSLTSLPQLIYKAMTGKAYKALGYSSVAEWSKEEFGISKARIYQLLKAQTLLIALRERYALDEEWEVPEEKMRHLNAERFEALLEAADAEVKGLADTKEKSKAVSDAVASSFRDYIIEKNLARIAKEAKKESTDSPAAANQPASIAQIQPVEPSLELLLVKAKDVQAFLSHLPEKATEKDIAVSQLREAQAVISELLSYYEAA